ncbi:MAG: T9SS type A sorting domain-containing protein [Salibacteraceae bacterium]
MSANFKFFIVFILSICLISSLTINAQHGAFTEGVNAFDKVENDFGNASRAIADVEEEWALNGGSPTSSLNVFNGVDADEDGNVYVIGTVQGNAQFGTINVSATSGKQTLVLGKISKEGQWKWIYAASGDVSAGLDLDIRDQKIVISGSFRTSLTFGGKTITSPTSNQEEGFVGSLDLNGNATWLKAISGAGTQNTEEVEIGSDGAIYIAGEYFNNVVLGGTTYVRRGTGEKDMYVASMDASGNFIWSADFGSIGRDFLEDMDLSLNDQLILTGNFTETMTLSDGKTFSSVKNNKEDAYVIVMSKQGGFIVYGGFSGDDDVNGAAVCFAPSGHAFLAINFDENINYFGQEYGSVGGDWGYLLITIAPSAQMSLLLAATGDEFIKGIDIDKNGNIYFTGGVIENGFGAAADITLFKIEWLSQSQFVVRNYGVSSSSNSWDQPYDLCADGNGGVYVVGEHEDKLYISGGVTLTSTAPQMAVVVAYSDEQDTSGSGGTTSLIQSISEQGAIQLYPNPVNDVLTIKFENTPNNVVDARVVDIYGKVVLIKEITTMQSIIRVEEIPAGLYFVQITNGDETTAIKFQKE